MIIIFWIFLTIDLILYLVTPFQYHKNKWWASFPFSGFYSLYLWIKDK